MYIHHKQEVSAKTGHVNDVYKHYRATIGDYKKIKRFRLSKNNFNKICKTINNEVIRQVLFEEVNFIVPYNLGTITLQKQKMNFTMKDGEIKSSPMNIDKASTFKLWREDPSKKGTIVYYTNEHTDGIRYMTCLLRKLSNESTIGWKFKKIKKHNKEFSRRLIAGTLRPKMKNKL
jgi:hypothetical protein